MTDRAEFEGSKERAASRGDAGNLLLPEDSSLAEPSVVDGLVRDFLTDCIGTRGRYLRGEIDNQDALAAITEKAVELQRIFYGKTNLYQRSPWNAEDRLGAYLVAKVNGGKVDDAISRLLLAGFKDCAEAGDANGAGNMDDETLQAVIEDTVGTITAHLLGVPPDSFTEEGEPEVEPDDEENI